MHIIIKNKQYGEHHVLKDANITCPLGMITCISGPSGCGKSTLLRIINQLDFDYDGVIHQHGLKVSYVTQTSLLIEKYSVYENIEVAVGIIDDQQILKISKILKIDNLLHKRVNSLSGGERQRVTILRALCQNADYVMLDEPTSNLDYTNGKILLTLLQTLVQEYQVGIILTTHESYIKDLADINYQYDNKQFITNDDVITGKISSKQVGGLEPLVFNIKKYYYRYSFKNSIYLIVMMVLMILVMGFNYNFNNYLKNEYDLNYGSIDPNYILVEKQYQETICKDTCVTTRNFEDITFTNDELTKIKAIEGVKATDSIPIESPIKYDLNMNKVDNYALEPSFYQQKELQYLVDINKQILLKNKDVNSIQTGLGEIVYNFEAVNVPNDAIKAKGYQSKFYLTTQLIAGDNKFINDHQIIIPKSLAIYYAKEQAVEVEGLIKKYVQINVFNQPNNSKNKEEYQIIGIYDESLAQDVKQLGNIYVAGNINLTSSYYYQQLNTSVGSDHKFLAAYENEDAFTTKNETGIPIVMINAPTNQKEIIEQLRQLFPKAKIMSQTIYQEENFVSLKLRVLLLQILILLIIISCYYLTSKRIKKIYFKSSANDYLTLQAIGYPQKDINHIFNKVFDIQFTIAAITILIGCYFIKIDNSILLFLIFIICHYFDDIKKIKK